jgi:hypothetical protein
VLGRFLGTVSLADVRSPRQAFLNWWPVHAASQTSNLLVLFHHPGHHGKCQVRNHVEFKVTYVYRNVSRLFLVDQIILSFSLKLVFTSAAAAQSVIHAPASTPPASMSAPVAPPRPTEGRAALLCVTPLVAAPPALVTSLPSEAAPEVPLENAPAAPEVPAPKTDVAPVAIVPPGVRVSAHAHRGAKETYQGRSRRMRRSQ